MRRIVLLGVAGHFDIQAIQLGIAQSFEGRGRRLEELFDGLTELVVLNQHSLNGKPRIELNITYRLMVGWIGHRHIKLVASSLQRQSAVLAHQLLTDQFLRLGFFVQRPQIKERNTKLLTGDIDKHPTFDQLVLHQPSHQRRGYARLAAGPAVRFFVELAGKNQLAGQTAEGAFSFIG